MPVTPSYLTYVLDQLGAGRSVFAKRMFGGVGLYQGSLFFGAVDDDCVYLRVNDESRARYVKLGMPALRPVKSKPDMVMEAYYQLPAEVLDDLDELRDWVRQAIAAASAAPVKKRSKRKAAAGGATKAKPKPVIKPAKRKRAKS